MRAFTYSLFAAAALALAAPVAHAQEVLEVEGPITNVGTDQNGNFIEVMGIRIAIPAGIPISSPTASLTFGQLLGDPLPGRPQDQPGFLGGTAIITGISEIDTPDNIRTAQDVFVEPAENVVVGVLTASNAIEGMTFELIDDPRIPSSATNEFGFDIALSSLVAGAPAAIEGYYSAIDQIFHAFLVEVTGGQLLNAGVPEVSIQRAQCRQRDNGQIEVEVIGGTHDPSSGTVTVTNPTGTIVYGTANVVQDAVSPQFGTYRFRRRAGGLGPCTNEITVNFNNIAVVTAPQEVRID